MGRELKATGVTQGVTPGRMISMAIPLANSDRHFGVLSLGRRGKLRDLFSRKRPL
jgi:hypothetical protein